MCAHWMRRDFLFFADAIWRRCTMYKILLLLIYACKSDGYGYDSGTDQGACGKPFRSSRMHQPPCDLNLQTYCTSAGTMYPWHAVRRFVRENQGLMRRMYGDERHIAVLRAELQTNDVTDDKKLNLQDEDLFKNGDFMARYSKQDHDFDNELFEEKAEETARYFEERREDIILNTKFVYGQDPNMQIKFKDLQPPRFRPMTQKPVESNTETVGTQSEPMNKTSTPVYENTTETFYAVDDDANATDSSITSTEDVTDTTTVTEEFPETTTQFLKKEPTGEVLFQDMENNKANTPSHHMNYKLRGVNACPVKEEVVAPFWANNTRGEVLALLNMYPFEQYVHWEKCTYEHRQMYCRDGCRCEQQYRLHRLLAYDPNNECRGIFSDWFKFPSCCVCKCYDMPAEFRVTSRSPRSKDEKPLPNWFKKKNKQKTYNKN